MDRGTDYNIARRTAEEVNRLLFEKDISMTDFVKRSGILRSRIYGWMNGAYSPNALSLAKLHAQGVDVLYIITGKRERTADSRPYAEK